MSTNRNVWLGWSRKADVFLPFVGTRDLFNVMEEACTYSEDMSEKLVKVPSNIQVVSRFPYKALGQNINMS